MTEKSYKSAVVIMPPEGEWEQIQNIRRKHDKAYPAWMPHINLVYPFVEDDSDRNFRTAAQRMCMALAAVQPFRIRFNKESFGYFTHGRKCTVWLKPLEVKATGTTANKRRAQQKKQVSGPGGPRPTKGPHALISACVDRTVRPAAHLPTISRLAMGPREASVGLDALSKAIWTPENTHDDVLASPTGLDCLRFATWSPDAEEKEAAGSCSSNLNPRVKAFIPGQSYMSVTCGTDHLRSQDNEVQREYESSNEESTTDDESSESSTEAEEEQDEQEVGEEGEEEGDGGNDVDNPWREMKRATRDYNRSSQSVRAIHGSLETLYPDFRDLSSKSTLGFQPHLTLGQCPASKVKTFINELKARWRNIDFVVDKIVLISRTNTDPYSVKRTVPIGTELAP